MDEPFIIKVNSKYAGFALIRKITNDSSNDVYNSRAEFIVVMKKYRKMGVGRIAAIIKKTKMRKETLYFHSKLLISNFN
ncbi:hypothetical protein D0S48_08745 [Psychrobacillus sp. AK 1817]|nr:hypothetical protein D0S48_08745 [Psychrobacillus sp. AK 1817]